MSTTSDGEHSYPSWLPKRPPPPAPASTYNSTTGLDTHGRPRVLDIFPSARMTGSPSAPSSAHIQGRKPTPRSVRIVAKDAEQWRVDGAGSRSRLREQTGDSAETRVIHQHSNQVSRRHHMGHSSMSVTSHHRPQPRFRAPSLHLDLLRSPTLFMHLRYRLQPIFVFGHLILQTFFDFNVVFMLLQIARHPGPINNPRNWNLATAVYLACYFLQIVFVFILYELVYSFWRRWRVKRPLILPIYLSSAAHNLVGLTSYTNYCFLTYIRRSARPSFRSLVRHSSPPLIPPPSVLPTSPPGSGSLHSHPPTSPQTHARSQSLSSTTTTSSTDTSSTGFLNFFVSFTPYIAESAYFFSQNTPTVVLLLPRAALCLALLLQSPAGADLGRDSTYFDANGALTSYARGILFANAIWTLWRSIVLLGSFTTLWILSGSACAGICGPRYRWEEYPDPESEVEVDENDDWTFVNLNPWLRAHPRNPRRRRRRDTSDLVVHDREPETQEIRDREHESTTSSFFSPISPAPIPSEVGLESGIEGDRKPSPHASPRIRLASPVHSRPVTRTMAYPNDTHYPTPPVRAYMAEDPPLSDSWNWKRGTRRRIREAWEFCLTNTGGKWLGSSSGGPVDAVGKKDEGGVNGDGDSPRTRAIIQQRAATAPSDLEGSGEHDISLDSEDFKGLEEVLRQSVLHRNVLRSRPKFSPSAVGLSDIIPPPEGPLPSSSDSTTQVHSNIVSPPVPDQAYGSQRSRRSDPLRVLPFPIQIGPVVGSGGMGTPGTAPATATTTTLSSYPPSAFATAPIGTAPTVSTPPIPATPTTATTLIMTGIPFPSPTRSRSRTRLRTQESEEGISRIIRGEGEEQEIEEEEREHEEEEEEVEEVEEVEEEGETEDYDDDFIDDEEEEGEGYEEDYGDDYENIDEFEREADIEEYDDDYDLTGSPRGAEEQGDPEEQDVTYDEFGAPISRRKRRTSASVRSGTVSGSGSASMSSLGKPINESGTNLYGVYAFSTVGSATMSSASRSAGRSGTHSTSHGGSRMGTVSSRGSRGTRASFSPASASVSASRSGATGSVSATGTRSSRGSTRANRGDPTVSHVAGRVRQSGRGRRNGEGKTIDNDGSGKGRGEKIVTASPAVSVPVQSQQTPLSVSPHSHVQSLSPQTIPSISASLSPASASSPHAASPSSAGRSPDSQNRDEELKLLQHSSNPQSLSPPPTLPLPPPPTAVHAQGSGARRERTRPRRERGREYTDHLHAPNLASPSAVRPHGSARTRTDSATLPPQIYAEPLPPPGEEDTSLDIEFPVPLGVYSPSGGRSSRSRRTETGDTARRRTRTMSSGFSGRGAELVLPQPMPEGYEEDEGDGSHEVEQSMSYLGSGAAFPLAEMRETSVERNSLNDTTHLNEHSENEDILGLLSPTHPTSNPDLVPSSAPGSRAASTSTSPHTRSPRSSLKSVSSRPSLASLAANLGANLTTGVRHLGTSSQRVSFTGTPSRGSRSTSRENRFIQPGSGGTPPPPPPSQPSIRSRAQSLIQSIRNRSSSFVELVEMHEDGGDDGGIRSVEGSPVHSGVEEDDEDITMALTSTSPTQHNPRSLMQSNEDEDELRLSSPSHSSGSPFSNPNSTAHTPSSNSHSPPTRIIGVPRGIEFGSSRRESSGTASSSNPSGERSSGEGRRPLSMLSTSGLAAPGAGSEGTFGRPGELAGFVRRERELAIDRGEVTDVDGQRRTSLPSGLVHGYLPTIPSMDMMNMSRSQTDLNTMPQGENDDHIGPGIVPTSESRIVQEPSTAPGTRTEPVSIPTSRQQPDPQSSPSGISTAPASFITATPSISFTHTSTTESVRGRGSGTEQGSDNTSAGNGSGSSGRGANASIDPLWRDRTRRGTGGPVAGGWHLGPA